MNREKSKSILALVVFCAGLTSGCSRPCEIGEIAGHYRMQHESQVLELKLAGDSTGELIRDLDSLGTLTWELEENEQIFLRVSREMADEIHRFSTTGPPRMAPPFETRYSYVGVSPVCGRTGAAQRVELDVDGQRYLSRVQD